MNKKTINANNILNNIKIIKSKLSKTTLFCAVLKANAYGHGLSRVVKIIKNKVDYFATANILEALKIRKICPDKHILVLGKLEGGDIILAIKNHIEFSVVSYNHLLQINHFLRKCENNALLHIKINSGMNRLGISTIFELKKIKNFIKTSKKLKIIGIFTHFATIFNNISYFKQQKRSFYKLIKVFQKDNILIHCSSSNGFLFDNSLTQNMVRIGIALYGYDETHKLVGLKPVLTLTSSLIQIHKITKGSFVGYGAEFVATKNTFIGVVGIGYADGIPRQCNKEGYVLIRGIYCKIISRICMDMLFVDLSNCKKCQVGDKVVFIGKSYSNTLTATNWAEWCDTIEYEILTNLSLVRQ